jgi:hypothetical protein
MKLVNSLAVLALALLCLVTTVHAQSILDGTRISGVFFVTYQYQESNGIKSSEFGLERGYINIRKNINDRVGIRFTQDVTIDQEGDGEGDIELRIKYALVNYRFDDYGIFTSPQAEFGVIRRPWTDFEQTVNDYRMQNSMMLDLERIAPSADYGIALSALLGPRLENPEDYNLNSGTAGKYGSIIMGLYNGAGYAELEKNINKHVEGRFTYRPFWDRLPGLQLTYAGAYGKGNIPSSPDFYMHVGYLSFNSKKIIVAFQRYIGNGDVQARRLTETGQGLPMHGYNSFIEWMPFKFPLSIVNRYDVIYDRRDDRMIKERGIVGVAWRFANGSKIMVDYDRESLSPVPGAKVVNGRWEIATEIRF